MGVHLPTYLVDRGLSVEIGGWTLALIGLFNIVGSIGSGWLGNMMPKRFILAAIYFGRSLANIVYILLPASSVATVIFGAVMGILWLSAIPDVVPGGDHVWRTLAGHVARRCIHQPPARGGFLGVWLGGFLVFSNKPVRHDAVWWLAIVFWAAFRRDKFTHRRKSRFHRLASAPT